MAYALKSTGIATNLIFCMMVDEDGTTLKDFKGNTDGVISGSVTIGTKTWKSVSRKYFKTLADGFFNAFGVTWSGTNGPLLTINDSDGAAIFVAFAANSAGSGPDRTWLNFSSSNDHGLKVNSSTGKGQVFFGGSPPSTDTTIPTDESTKFSVGANWKSGEAPTNAEMFYGAESGSLALEDQVDPGNFGSSMRLICIGGSPGNGNQPSEMFIVTMFNRQLTEAEMQSLHTDWFGTLFEAPAGGGAKRLLSGMPIKQLVGGSLAA